MTTNETPLDTALRQLWHDAPRWNREAALAGERRIVCPRMIDWLDDMPTTALADFLALIAATPNLDWLLLTKRPENFRSRIGAILNWIDRESNGLRDKEWLRENRARSPFLPNDWLAGRAPANVWIGASVEDRAHAAECITRLIDIPARAHFLSFPEEVG